MKTRIRSLIKKIFPQRLVSALRAFFDLPLLMAKRRTERNFSSVDGAPPALDIRVLEKLQEKYPPLPDYGYDEQSLADRGVERAAQILRLPGAKGARSFLELGCWDGMVSWGLQRKGKQATAIDFRDIGFDQRASQAGVRLLQMDAAGMTFEDGEFDFVFSYDAFEHFTSPEDVLREAIRVLREGGHIYMEFGPLYFSPYGEHAYRSITVPYCQFLFEKDLLNVFADQKGLEPIDFSHVNGWSLEQFRALWTRYEHSLRKVRYFEHKNLSHLSLIRKYPASFKYASSNFENFIVSSISVLFQKVGNG